MAATLHVMCGKIASGKTTFARALAADSGAILICEDIWLDQLFPGERFTLQDYIRRSAGLRAALGPHVAALLRSGLSVVFDFAGNTVRDRQWVRSVFEAANADHLLHYLNVPDDVCKARLRAEPGCAGGLAAHDG